MKGTDIEMNKTSTKEKTSVRSSLGDVLESVKEECADCGICREECGFLEKYGTPKEIADNYDPGTKEGQVMPFECSLCRLCDAVCPFDVNPSGMFLEMRRESVYRGAGSFPEHTVLLDYEKRGMSKRFTWYGLPEGCRTVFFPGCALPGTRPGRTKEIYELLRKNDPSLGIVLDCCGKISHGLGREQFFRAMFEEMRNYLLLHGVKEILVACPNCHDMFSRHGDGLNVRTVYEALPENIVSNASKSHTIVIHDPCGVRFHTDTHATIRRLIGMTGVTSQEMDHTKERTLCCGSGAGVNALSPELADRWLERTRKEAGERQIVTYCAGCAGRMSGKAPVVYALDVFCEPEVALAGKSKVSVAPFTYLNRLCIKSFFKKAANASVSRERTCTALEEKKKGWAGRLAILAVLVAAILTVRITGATRYLDQEALRQLIAGYGMLAPLIYMLIYAVAPSLLLPGLPITIVGGILFGPLWGVVYTITSSTIGGCLAFLVSRYVARDWIEGKLRSPRWRRLDEGVEKHGWKVVAFTRLIPLFPFNLLNYAFGMTKIGFWPYAVTTFICMLPACIAFIVFSSSLLDLIKGKISPTFVIGIVLIVMVSLIPFFYRRYQKKKGIGDPL
ncbi:MAG: VTT domain-containing protein [Syntrophaceae bacterium]